MIRGLVNAPSVSIFPHLSGTARDSLRGMGGGGGGGGGGGD